MEISETRENKQHGTFLLPYDVYGTLIPKFMKGYPIHWHDELEIVFVKKGKCSYIVNFREYIVCEGDVLIIPPSYLHSFSQYENEFFDARTMLISQRMLNNNVVDICSLKYIQPIYSNEIILPIHIKKGSEHNETLFGLLKKAYYCHRKKKPGYELKMKAYFLEFICYFFENECNEKNIREFTSMRTSEYIKQVIQYIETHFKEKIMLEDIAGYVNLSSYHLSHLFKKSVGQSPLEYVKEYRIITAAREIRETNKSILDISIDCGFNNISYFNRSFKEKYGITPGEYRKMKV